MRWIIFTAFGMLVCICPAAIAADETYSLNLNHPYKPGDAYSLHMVLDGTREQTMTPTSGEPQARTERIKADLSGRIDITSVDGKGDKKTFTLTIDKFMYGVGDAEAIPSGTTIEVTRSPKEVIYKVKDGEDIRDDVKETLSWWFSPLNSSDVTDNDIEGSKLQRKVGESWEVNINALVKSMAGEGVTADPKHTEGRCTLKGVRIIQGTRFFQIETESTFKNVVKQAMASTVTFDKSDVRIQDIELVPFDSSLPILDIDLKENSDIVMTNIGTQAKLEVAVDMHRREAVIPLKDERK